MARSRELQNTDVGPRPRLPSGERNSLPGAVLRRFVRWPLEFFYPPRDAGPPAATQRL